MSGFRFFELWWFGEPEGKVSIDMYNAKKE